MQFTNVLCYVFMTITVAACAAADDKQTNELKESQPEGKRISKRDATLLIGGPEGTYRKPQVIYRRISHQKYGPLKPYGPTRPRYKSHSKPPKINRKPGKKYKHHKAKHVAPKYVKPNNIARSPYNKHHKRNSKPRYGPPPKPRPGPGHGRVPPPYGETGPEHTSFGEPPVHYEEGATSYQRHKQSYGEPPVDSYGAPLKLNNEFDTMHSSAPQSFHESNNFGSNYHSISYPPWATNNWDAQLAYSKKQPSVYKHKPEVEPEPTGEEEEFYQEPQPVVREKKYPKKKKPSKLSAKIPNRPWLSGKKPESEPDIIVGGQYAEPPARFVKSFQASAPMMVDDDQSFSPHKAFYNSPGGSASAYVNYKNSNLAFSPQNLNDAFSIVDKK
ncbi:uncharacterized protein LOC142982148 [Anticarsia gemmatalis]|uniref:uncharacterized protein LOC142982148 n=1 Tax=Anticarsia gemmatalis TaxID=129554 RepID=UPI003F75C9C4